MFDHELDSQSDAALQMRVRGKQQHSQEERGLLGCLEEEGIFLQVI